MQSDIGHEIRCLTAEISEFGKALRAFGCDLRNEANKAILDRIAQMEANIKMNIKEYTDKVNADFDEIATAVDSIVASQAGITADVQFLKDTIAKINSNPGTITPEDQALLDAAETRASGLATKTKGVSDALAALDAATDSAPVPTP